MSDTCNGAKTNRNLSCRNDDADVLRSLITTATGVELYTIPLYMASLYSIRGFATPDPDGVVWPGLGITAPSQSNSPNERAYNAIFTVYIQEMFHLQLAGNIAAAVGCPPNLSEIYSGLYHTDNAYGGSTSIPCVGEISEIPNDHDPYREELRATGAAAVTSKFGPMDRNQALLFLAIETPNVDAKEGPTFPLDKEKLAAGFKSIGHLYAMIKTYAGLKYTDGSTLWNFVYDRNAYQIDQFTVNGDEIYGDHGKLHVTFKNPDGPGNVDAATAFDWLDAMIAAIIEQGEGADEGESATVPVEYQPDKAVLAKNGRTDAEVRATWDEFSHFKRFEDVYAEVKSGDITTWPLRADWTPDDKWTWEKFWTKKTPPSPELKTALEARAAAYNSDDVIGQLNGLLNAAFSSLLDAISNNWKCGIAFSIPAMSALASRVKALWAAGGQPEFLPVVAPTIADPHACQGLNTCAGQSQPRTTDKTTAAGDSACAMAVGHVCVGQNSCASQGGCGYPKSETLKSGQGTTKDNTLTGTSTDFTPPNFIPSQNSGIGDGGCGAPIPVAQVFNNNYKFNDGKTVDVVYAETHGTHQQGDSIEGSVWDRARYLLAQKLGKSVSDLPDVTANDLRQVIPPS